ncbi:hypothetical protein DOK_09631 [gamma proteobacterium BDW918]|uniref:Wadjet protein JetD C-terminal domain-containing protein n=1 Tax=Zhongshania aliphaticivorans TaxID=1470434 RepID=A0A127M5Z2_9GAMM|nr:Wadjet anti-phage system protein JetD domain-containing protein [Zhongshania aliphaticivorans]AMO68645.1 hypothetical protein AZF00_10200 [Zhongshania aliphaticivorans]EIF43116.1 hypothetical protein DOK_09631 [gamma proteobacterium BDW918]
MKFPDDVQKVLLRRFRNRHREWLEASGDQEKPEAKVWPLKVALGIPTENQALKQVEDVRSWVAAWQSWRGAGSLSWSERRWRKLGTQPVPEKLLLSGPDEVAQWIGEADRWDLAQQRYRDLIGHWPQLGNKLPRYFAMLADYSEVDYQRLVDIVAWIEKNPGSNLYPRQLPVSGLDSKWLEIRKGLLADLVDAVRGGSTTEGNFFQCCGLQAPPQLIRLRILDDRLRQRVGGLSDLSTPWKQLAELDLPVSNVFIVENLQTGLAFDDLPGSVVIMHLGYGVDVLGRLPWVARAHCVYWGDLDTHGFAILNRARSYLPKLTSVLMDEVTLRSHQDLWVEEKDQHAADTLPLLTGSEQAVYQAIKRNAWGQNVRLEQERIAWTVAWNTVQQTLLSVC